MRMPIRLKSRWEACGWPLSHAFGYSGEGVFISSLINLCSNYDNPFLFLFRLYVIEFKNQLNHLSMERKILGVCAWFAQKTNIDVNWVRIGFVVATIIGVGSPILIYFILYFMLHLKWIE